MKKNAIKHWPLSVALLFVASVGVIAAISGHSNAVQAAGTNIIGIQLTDNGQGSADCSHRDQDGGLGLANIGSWTPWTGDSDQYDADCVRLYIGNSVTSDTDIQIGLQAEDVNTPCGFLWTQKCADGGGAIAWGPWAADSGGNSSNTWTGWASDADAWDPDEWRVVVNTRPWVGHSITSFQVGIQTNDMGSGGGCGGEQTGSPQYTAPSSAGASYSGWAADNVDNQNFNCARINLLTNSSLNPPTIIFTGTSTVPYNSSVNLPWTVNNVNTSVGCDLTSPSDITRHYNSNGSNSITTTYVTSSVTYTMTCRGNDGSTVSASKTITTFSNPATVAFTMTPTSVTPGGTATATISVIDAQSCSIVGKDTSGNIVDSGYSYSVPPPSAQIPVPHTATDIYGIGPSSGVWGVPANWNTSNNSIEIISAGGHGGFSGASAYGGGGGGGGGGYAKAYNVPLPGGQNVSYAVQGGGNGSYSWIYSTAYLYAYSGGGGGGQPGGGGGGGGCGASYNGPAYCGGAGGKGGGGCSGSYCGSSGAWGGGGGGGAAGPYYSGAPGGGDPGRDTCAGSGGGGADGGGGGAAGYSGAGGGGGGPTGGGRGGNAAVCGGGDQQNGGWGTEWLPQLYAAGGGGGGGSDNNYARAGDGGAYGGGGGGAGDDSGAQGYGFGGVIRLINVYNYYTYATADNTDVHTSAHTINGTTDFTVDCLGLNGTHTIKTVRVTNVGGACLLDGVSIPDGGSGNFYSQSTPTTGHVCSEYGPQARGCSAGTLTGNAAYKYASCTTQTGITISANGLTAGTSIRKGAQVALSWNGGNATSCSVTGTDGYNGKDIDGTTPIVATKAATVTQKTIYTLSCTLGNSTKKTSVTVNLLPTVIEN